MPVVTGPEPGSKVVDLFAAMFATTATTAMMSAASAPHTHALEVHERGLGRDGVEGHCRDRGRHTPFAANNPTSFQLHPKPSSYIQRAFPRLLTWIKLQGT